MKKTVSILAALTLIAAMLCVPAFAADSAQVYVTIANGSLMMAQQPVTVTDTDGDGALTINDALYCAHEAGYSGGAAAGYGSAVSDYGMSITKLWGVENGSGFGYYVNNASAMSLTDAVKDGDFVNAFVYTDTTAFSDVYCYFDAHTVTAGQVTLTLSAAAYDENWNPVVKPVEGAEITIDGKAAGFITDANGSVTFTASSGVISAVSGASTLVPPVCVAEAAVNAPQTGDCALICVSLLGLASASALLVLRRKK